jgi:hypothetical protein
VGGGPVRTRTAPDRRFGEIVHGMENIGARSAESNGPCGRSTEVFPLTEGRAWDITRCPFPP